MTLKCTYNHRSGLQLERVYAGTEEECETQADRWRAQWADGYDGIAMVRQTIDPQRPGATHVVRCIRSLTCD